MIPRLVPNASLHRCQAKLGNSWVSPNVGHLILKYLCPALHEVLQDGLKAYVLDLIIGQRRCQPWSLVEASTQLGERFTLRRGGGVRTRCSRGGGDP